jgi:DNA polymerase-3 subunit gamma/tau
MAFQSLYRRFRPQRFIDVRGQDHVSLTLRNAVRDGRVAHAYLFSGPRGTGKTSSARILAKALNCANPDAGEPCGVCTSCVEIAEGRSLDVLELDAASNRGVDAMRDLVSRANLGTPGRWKVYIVDEVHMLTTEASNTLLKTLEEPPGHVIFVLATTEPQKVLPTIRSRTQHFEFHLLSVDVLTDHLRWVCEQAGLDIPDEVIRLVAKRGAGSARDALSKLDQVAAAGGIDDAGPSTDEVVEALCERDLGRALVAVAERVGAGHDPRRLAGELLEHLRQAFLATVARGLVGLPDDEVAHMESQAARMGRAAIVRAMEVLGDALIAMRDAPDTRVLLEVSLVRLCRPEADVTPAAMLERIERLERRAASGPPTTSAAAPPASPGRPAVPAPSTPVAAPAPAPAPATPAPPAGSPAAAARLALGGVQGQRGPGRASAPPPQAPPPAPTAPATPPPSTPSAPPPTAAATGAFPTRDDLTLAWGDVILPALPPKPRARFRAGRFVDVAEPDTAGFALPTPIHRERCAEVQGDVERALAAHFGRRVPLKLLVETELGAAATPESDEEEHIDPRDLRDAPSPGVSSPVDHVMQAFEGATLVEE